MSNSSYLVGVGVVLCAACGASAPTKELRTARDAYSQASNGPTRALNPTGLHEANTSLARAEQAHLDSPGSAEEKGYAYIAERRVQLAVAKAGELAAKRDEIAADESFKSALVADAARSKAESSSYSAQLQDAKGDLKEAKGDIVTSEQARLAAEARTQEALRALEKLAAVKQEQNRVVITLSGSVLFKTGSSELLAMARDRLTSVAQALTTYGNAPITVSGHTDSRGTDEANQTLSQGRADSVRGYLISQGLPAANITAVGRGESTPVADNTSQEGQASNRRVEIVVDRAQQVGAIPAQPAPVSVAR